jgi:MIP family channel proteins
MNRWLTRDDVTKSLAEFLATFAFVFLGIGAAGATAAAGGTDTKSAFIIIGLAHGLGIMIGVAAIGRISGGHLNPAVTIAAAVTGNISLVRGALYIAAQVAGAVLAVSLLRGVMFDTPDLGLHQVSGSLTSGEGVLVEAVLTFILVFTIFATAIDRRGSAVMAPFAIGMVVAVDHFVAVGLTGASMNPARSFGAAAISGNFNEHWVYWVGPVLGGLIAALVYVSLFGDSEARARLGRVKVSGGEL